MGILSFRSWEFHSAFWAEGLIRNSLILENPSLATIRVESETFAIAS